jgi:hypothetical protein
MQVLIVENMEINIFTLSLRNLETGLLNADTKAFQGI